MQFVCEDNKMRVDKFLVEKTGFVRARVQRDIDAGNVMVGGKVASGASVVVRKGEVVEYNAQDITKVHNPKNLKLTTVFENEGMLVVDKPAGLTVHPGPAIRGDTLTDALLFHFPYIKDVGESVRPGIVHRLDKDTSGCIIVAKNNEYYEYLKSIFETRDIKKFYIALVKGHFDNPHGIIDTPIGKSKNDFRKMTTIDPIEEKPSMTEYSVIEELVDGVDKYSLIKVQLHTGRTHQIRVHMASISHTLLGDELYGGRLAIKKGLSRQFLHAYSIELRLPNHTWIEVISPLPNDLISFLKDLNSKKYLAYANC